MRDILFYYSNLYEGDYDSITKAIKNKEKVNITLLNKYKKETLCKYITILDDNYPKCFKDSYQPPYVIYYEGSISLIKRKKRTAIIGSRNYSEYGKSMALKIAKEFVANNHVIISGAAKGIDIIAQDEVLNNGGKTIAVIGSGLNIYYPFINKKSIENIKKQGLVISEYPPDTKPKKQHFPMRNRLIAALANEVIVIEAKTRSGTLITVRHALDLGKDIYCIPYRVCDNSLCNELLKQGAYLIESYEDYNFL